MTLRNRSMPSRARFALLAMIAISGAGCSDSAGPGVLRDVVSDRDAGGPSDADLDALGRDAGTGDSGENSDVIDDGGPFAIDVRATDSGGDVPRDAAVAITVLARTGTFFVPSAAMSVMRFDLAPSTSAVTTIRVAFDVRSGDWQPEIPDMYNRQEHILFGLLRARERLSWRRYLMGTAAVNRRGFVPNYVMYSREAFVNSNADYIKDPDPRYRWEIGVNYHVDCLLDALAREQHCTLGRDGAIVTPRDALIPWVVPEEHLSTGFLLEIGLETANKGESPPIGWEFSNLQVSVTRR